MKKTLKTIAAILCLTSMLGLASGCTQKETAKDPAPSTGQSQAESTPSTPDKKSDFPKKQVTIIMPWSLGGGPDTIARQVASYGEKYLGVPVIVENKNGGAGTIAMAAALKEKDEGDTMVVANGPLVS